MVIFDRLLVAVTKLQSNLLTQDTWISSGSPILALLHSGNLLNYLTKDGTIFFIWANRRSSQLQNPRRLKWSRLKFIEKDYNYYNRNNNVTLGHIDHWKTVWKAFWHFDSIIRIHEFCQTFIIRKKAYKNIVRFLNLLGI